MIQANANIQQFNQEREREIQEIAERAMQDKDPNEKEWYNIFITHQFVNKMLRDKIDREMMKFSTVEFAFKTIKTATVATFLLRESVTRRPWSSNISTKRQCMGICSGGSQPTKSGSPS